MSLIFYQHQIFIPTSFSSYIKYQEILPLKNYILWIFFANARWITYDLRKNIQLCEGKFDIDFEEYCHAMRRPRIYDDNNIIYVNEIELKLNLLNPFNGKIDNTWNIDIPSYNALSGDDRKSNEKIINYLDDCDIVVLENTNIVIVLERKDYNLNNIEYFISAFIKNDNKPIATTRLINTQMKRMLLKKINEDDTVCIYPDYAQPKLSFYIWDLTKPLENLKTFEYNIEIAITLENCDTWGYGHMIFFGNPDIGGPQAYVCKYEPFNHDGLNMIDLGTLKTKETLIKDMIFCDSKSYMFLLEQSGEDCMNSITLYDAKRSKVLFYNDCKDSDIAHAISQDKKYFIGYEAKIIDDEDMGKPSTTHIYIMGFTTKKLKLIYLLKKARIMIRNKFYNLLEYYGNPFIVRHVAEMLD